MDGVIILFCMFVTGLYGSIAYVSVNELKENKKRREKYKYGKINSKLKNI